MMTVSNLPIYSPEKMRRMHIYGEAMVILSGADPMNGNYEIDAAAVGEFMKRSPLHERYVRELIGKPKDWAAHDNYMDAIGWVCGDSEVEEPA